MTKHINELQVGDKVASFDATTFDRPYQVTSVRSVTLKGKTFPVFILLEGGRFWPTGKDDPRTCVTV